MHTSRYEHIVKDFPFVIYRIIQAFGESFRRLREINNLASPHIEQETAVIKDVIDNPSFSIRRLAQNVLLCKPKFCVE